MSDTGLARESETGSGPEGGRTDGISNELKESSDATRSSSDLDATSFTIRGMQIRLEGTTAPALETIRHPLPKQFSHFEELRREEKGCDVTIEMGEYRVRAHRALLAARCPYFKSLFKFGDRSSSVITLSSTTGIGAETFKHFINYIYTGRLSISNENCQELLLAASYLMMESVVNECDSFIRKFVRHYDVLPLRNFCDWIAYNKLEQFFLRIIDLNFVPISLTAEFLDLPIDRLLTILERDSLRIDDEKQVFAAIDRWIGADSARTMYAERLLRCVRFSHVSSSFVSEVVERKEWVMDCPTSTTIINEPEISSVRVCDDAVKMIALIPDYGFRDESIGMAVFNPINNVMQYGVTQTDDRETVSTEIDPCAHPSAIVNGQDIVESGGEYGTVGKTLIIAGGEGMAGSTFCFDTKNPDQGWTEVTPMNRSRYLAASCSFNGKFFVFGGVDDDCREITDCESYDLENNEWTVIEPMYTRRSEFIATEFRGRLFVVGGVNPEDGQGLKEAESYDPATNMWTKNADMHSARLRATVVVTNGRLFVAGGFRFDDDGRDEQVHTLEEYLPESDEWIERGEVSIEDLPDAGGRRLNVWEETVPATIPIDGLI